ncbi:MAG: InlB B-repeat-containing protein, partial [Clostridia bacterium]|nr:InlB B-repeat-containing protein [Clostridia bacterium]
MKLKKWLGTLLILVTGIAAVMGLAACDNSSAPSGDTVAVTWYDGRTILKEESVKKGEKLTEWEPTKSGYEFLDWYSESSLSKKFDFDTVSNEDTNVYSKWRTTTVARYERMWYAIGTISG